MPWIKIGPHSFDLKNVELLTEGEVLESSMPSVTIFFLSGRDLVLTGGDAISFLGRFAEETGSRSFGRDPASVVLSDTYTAESRPVEAVGIKMRPLNGGHPAGDHEGARILVGDASTDGA